MTTKKEDLRVAAWQYQDSQGNWHSFVNEIDRLETIDDGTWPIRALYTEPPKQHSPARYFVSGPKGHAWFDDLALAYSMIALFDKDHDWTITDTHDELKPKQQAAEVTEEMVDLALAAYNASRGTYSGEVPTDRDDIRAALLAALEEDREYVAEMNEAKKELEAAVGLVGKATPGEWMLATSCSWRRVVTTEHQPVITPITQRIDNHPDLEAGEAHVNLEASITAVNFLRTHGSAMISAMKDAERWQKLRIQGGWPDTEAAMLGASPEDFDRLIDVL